MHSGLGCSVFALRAMQNLQTSRHLLARKKHAIDEATSSLWLAQRGGVLVFAPPLQALGHLSLPNLYVFAQESGHIEVLAVDDRWLALFEPTPRDRLEL